jgi:hypothetical protein
MNYREKNIISESEKNDIRSMYGIPVYKRDFIFELCTTVDGRYFILRDEVFDIKEQKTLGNLWSSIDIFKNIFSNVSIQDTTGEFNQIKENILSLPLLEGKDNLYGLRDILLEWSFTQDTWLGRELASSGKAIKDTVTSGWEGLTKMGVAISKGEWSEIFNLLKSGVLFVLRKLKDAAYSSIGTIVDAILVATGIGKGFQMGAWGLITALDVYQISTNKWPSDDDRDQFWKHMDLGFDLLGLVFAGVAAKGAKSIFKPLTGLSVKNMASKVARNPKMKSIITNILSATKSGGSRLKSVQSTISKKWPSGGKFINSILGSLENILKKLQTYLSQIISTSNLRNIKNVTPGKGFVPKVKTTGEFLKRGGKSGGIAGGLMYGIDSLGRKQETLPFDDLDFNSLPISNDEF